VLNLTVVEATAEGTLIVFPAGELEPSVSTIGLTPGRTLANNAIIGLSADGPEAITAHNDSAGTVMLVADISGYFVRSDCTPPPAGMAAWWPFDETAGSVAGDLAGGHDGTLVNGPAPVAGVVEGARSFNGTNQSVQVADADGIDFGTGDFSFDAWLRTSRSGGFVDVILDKRSVSGSVYLGYHVFLYQGRLGLQLDDGGFTNYGSQAFVADGAWHHVAITVQRGAHDGIRWYVDGAEVLPRHDPTPHSGSLNNNSPLSLAVRSAGLGGGGNFQGPLDEVELFSRALSAGEVREIWQAGARGKCRP
jgi:hypothetical protein